MQVGVKQEPLLSPEARARVNQAIAPSRQQIAAHKVAIEKTLRAAGIFEDGDKLCITIGPELEHTLVFGESVAKARLTHLQLYGVDQPTDNKRSEWVPFNNRIAQAFDTPFLKGKNRIKYESEPARGPSIGARCDGIHNTLEAYAGREVVSYPLSSPEAAINWLIASPQRMGKEAHAYGIDAIDFSSLPNDATSPNSVHLHVALQIQKKDGRMLNLLSARDMDTREAHTQQEPSELALSIGHRLNALQRDEMLIFAPGYKSTARFGHCVGPQAIGFAPRKRLNAMPGAMFRGEDIRAHREEAVYGEPDKGPLRIELRTPSAEIIGHPDKERYPETAIFPALAIEQLVRSLREGVEAWRDTRSTLENGYQERVQKLYAERYPLPRTQLAIYKDFANSASARDYYGGARHGAILHAVEQLSEAYLAHPRVGSVPKGCER